MLSDLSYQKIGNSSQPKQYFNRKSLFVGLSLVQCFLLLFFYNYFYGITSDSLETLKLYPKKITQTVFKTNNTYCYDDKTNDEAARVLVTLNTSSVDEASVFFIETRCHTNTADILTKRQACAVESAAYTNPNMTVYVLFPSAVPFDPSAAAPYVRALFGYPNIKLRHISMVEYMKASPLEGWYERGVLQKSSYPLAHISDVLRLLSLWKFGGIYLDLDTITLKSLEVFVPFAAVENPSYIGNAAIGSPLDGIGHAILSVALEKIKENFRGDQWGVNGPVLLTDVLRAACKLEPNDSVYEMNSDRCQGFNIYPEQYFHPLPYYEWEKYFSNGTEAEETMVKVQNSYTVHTWNKMSHDRIAVVGSDQPYSQLAQRFCPLVYTNFGHEF